MTLRSYPTDLTDVQWALLAPHLPAARPGGRPRLVVLRAVVDAIRHLLRTGCQWRLQPRDFPPWVWWCFRRWRLDGVWTRVRRAPHRAVREKAGRHPAPRVVIMDSHSVKTTERGRPRLRRAHEDQGARAPGARRHAMAPCRLPIATTALLT